ncbi:transcription factor Ken [Periplaneta americana]|uniref:transcription factor Ken n=1 Tax=Periplaneta americana TaxID=6978 RepID=UPI0037E8AACE
MDITEAFRGEDISKTDFFDFVVTPDVAEQQSINFNRTLKSMGIFIESAGANNNNNNEPGTTTYQDVKEANNNHLMMTTTTAPSSLPASDHGIGNFGDHSFWSTSSCDKETVRLETAILEDLNKFCWNQDSSEAPSTNTNGGPCHKVSLTNTTHNNTDGAIYTLTVLNGGDHNATWYRAPEAPPSLKEDEENHQQSLSSPHNMDCQQISSHNNQQNHSSALDLDSILSIIPNQPSTTTTPTSNGHQFQQNGYHQTHPHPSNHLHQPNDSTATLSPHHHTINQDGLVKSEQQYAYEESGYASKDCINHIVDGPSIIQQEGGSGDSNAGFNNNNNDWKLANNNTNSTADSLLRSALQGKSFLSRYNGTSPKNGKAMEGHIELRRVLSTPPNGAKTSMEHSPVFITGDIADECSGGEPKQSPLMTVTMEGNAVVMFDGGGGSRGLGLSESDNPSSAHSMDDILLSQLDAASYPEDYEKLKRIANEVAESVNQYCSMDQSSLGSPSPHTPSGIYISAHLASADSLVPNSILSSTHHHHHHHHHASLSPILTSQSTSKPNGGKKYGKKQPGNGSNGGNKSAHGSHQLQSNGVRKERSLHYCNICSKGFKDKYSVNVHIRTHTGEKPFACSLCGKSFRQKAHLAKHYQTHMAQKNAAANSNGVAKPGTNKGRYNNPKPS